MSNSGLRGYCQKLRDAGFVDFTFPTHPSFIDTEGVSFVKLHRKTIIQVDINKVVGGFQVRAFDARTGWIRVNFDDNQRPRPFPGDEKGAQKLEILLFSKGVS